MKNKNLIVSLGALLLIAGCGSNSSVPSEVSSQPSVSSSIEASQPSQGTSTSSQGEISQPSASSISIVTQLEAVKNLKFEDNIISFDAVPDASEYDLEIKKGDAQIVHEVISATTFDVTDLNLAGNYKCMVKAINGNIQSNVTELEFTVLTQVQDVLLEAEAGLLDFGNCYKGNPLAHGGAYVGSIDNAGQGVYYNYFSYVAGTFEMECYYTTGSVGSFNDIYVNGTKQGSFNFDTNTGWGSADRYEPAKATAEITLEEGWNTILIKKDGDSSNNWGGWGELDYFVIKSNGMTYNIDDFTEVNSLYAPTYRLEAELATHVYKDGEGKWQASGKAATKGNASNGYFMGGLDNPGEGMEWHFNAPVAGNYEVILSFASDNANNPTDVMFYHANHTLRGIGFDAAAFNETIMHLDTGSGWDNLQENSQKITLALSQGENFIYAVKDNSWFFQADYIDLVYRP